MNKPLLMKCLEFSIATAEQIEATIEEQAGEEGAKIQLDDFDTRFEKQFSLPMEPFGYLALYDVGQQTARTPTAECFAFEYAHSLHHIVSMPKAKVAEIIADLRKEGVIRVEPIKPANLN